MSLFDRVVFAHMWSFLDYHSQVALKRSCKKLYEWSSGSELNLPDFRDFYYENLFRTAPALLYQCQMSQFIANSLVWVYRNRDTLLQVYFRIIHIKRKSQQPMLFPALWHIKLDYLAYEVPGSRNYVRGYAIEERMPGGEEFISDDVVPHPDNLVVYNKYKEQIHTLDFKKLWPGCTHGETHPAVACVHGKCLNCTCGECN